MRNKKLIILFSVLLGITLLVVFNSVLFSVQHVNVYCANREQSVYAEQVLSAHKIKKGSSIFLVNKNKVIQNVQSKVPQVRVLNIEKKFPNRIWINYIEETEYLQVTQGTQTYYLSKDLRVMRIADGVGGGDAIRLRFAGDVPSLQIGDTLTLDPPERADIVTDIFAGLALCGYDDTTVDLLYAIDVTGNTVLLTLSVKTATGKTEGMQWEILTPENMADKLRLAMSVYMSDKLTDEQKKHGKLIVAGNKVTYQGIDGGVSGV